jgi:hypothetical protein
MPPKAKNKQQLAQLANARAKKQQIAANKQEKQGHYDALFNSKRPATEPATSTPVAITSKKLKLGRPPGTPNSTQRTTSDAAAVAEGAARGSGSGPRSRAPARKFIPGQAVRQRAAEDLRRLHTQGTEQSRSLSTEIEDKLKGFALKDGPSIAAFAMLLCNGGSIDSAAEDFCAQDDHALEVEQLRTRLREQDYLLVQQREEIAGLVGKADDGQLGAITTR